MTKPAKLQVFLALVGVLTLITNTCTAQEIVRVGMIGLDTSHAPAFTKLFNATDSTGSLAKMRVVAAFPGGSEDIASSRDRVEGFTKQLADMGVEIVDSVEELVTKVDAVLLESVDGRKHLSQVLPVFQAGLPVFIDKPLAGDLTEALAINMLAKEYKARWFSSSSLRFSPSIIRFREEEQYNKGVRGATSWGPCSIEPTHTDLFWYGVHAVETLYTAMGTGCTSVTRSDNGDIVVIGQWSGNRTGTVRGIRTSKTDYGLVVFGEKEITVGGKYEGYAPLVERIANFFAGEAAPVSAEETIEMFTFMQAADTSRDRGGIAVTLEEVRQKHQSLAEVRVAALLSRSNVASNSGHTEKATDQSTTPVLSNAIAGVQAVAQVAFTEGPVWHPEHGVYFTDVENNRIMLHDVQGKTRVFRQPSGRANGLVFDLEGRLLACEGGRDGGNRRVTRTEADGTITILAEQFEGKRFNSPNDITIDAQGYIYFTDPRYGDRDDMQITDAAGRQVEGVYQISPTGEIRRVLTHEVLRPNGIAVSPDGKYLFVADNANDASGSSRKLWRFDVDYDHRIASDSGRVLFDWGNERGPDGMAIDADGLLYVTAGLNHPAPPFESSNQFKAAVYIISPSGDGLLNTIPVPADMITNCAFGGPDLTTLYITAGHKLWSISLPAKGHVQWLQK